MPTSKAKATPLENKKMNPDEEDKSFLAKTGTFPEEVKSIFTSHWVEFVPVATNICAYPTPQFSSSQENSLRVIYLREDKSEAQNVELDHKGVLAIIPIKNGEFISLSKTDYCVWKLDDENNFQKVNQKTIFKPTDKISNIGSLKVFDNKEFFYGAVCYIGWVNSIFIVNISSGEIKFFPFKEATIDLKLACCEDKKLFIAYKIYNQTRYTFCQLDINVNAKEWMTNFKELCSYRGKDKIIHGDDIEAAKTLKEEDDYDLNGYQTEKGVSNLTSCIISSGKKNLILEVLNNREGPFLISSILIWSINSDYSLSDKPIEYDCSNGLFEKNRFLSDGTFIFAKKEYGSGVTEIHLIRNLSLATIETFMLAKEHVIGHLYLMPDDTIFGVTKDFSYILFHSPSSYHAKVADVLPMMSAPLTKMIAAYAYAPTLFSNPKQIKEPVEKDDLITTPSAVGCRLD